MMRTLLTLFFTLFLLGTLPAYAQFTPAWTEDGPNVYVNVTPEKTVLSGEKEVVIAIEQIIRPHWHTYWQNPGDSGEPMRVRAELPEGFELADPIWPTPKKLPFGPLTNYGFEGSALILQTLKLPEDLPSGPVSIPIAFDILVCKEICIPETVETTLILNMGGPSKSALFKQARLDIPSPAENWTSTVSRRGDNTVLNISTSINPDELIQYKIEFFPYEYGLVDNAAQPDVTFNGSDITLSQKKGSFGFESIPSVKGVLVLEDVDGNRQGYVISPKISEAKTEAGGFISSQPSGTETANIQAHGGGETVNTLVGALLFALLGGVILNLMPCVFPVLSMKVLSLSKMSEQSAWEARKHGLAYAAGIIFSFLIIAGLLLTLKSGGNEIGWGFHLQNPVVILLLSFLLFLIGLNLVGFFEVGGKLMNFGGSFVNREGISGSFMTGILATTVATPCTAPFMAGALAYALVQPAFVGLLVFAFLGLGLALPYLIISFIPALQNSLPKPGPWMVTFKEFLAFPMFGAAVWLIWILSQQIGSSGVLVALLGLVGISFGLWMLKKSTTISSQSKRSALRFSSLTIIALTLFLSLFTAQSIEMAKDQPMPEFGKPFSPSSLSEALESDQPVFVEMTAAWCITCKFNNKVAIDIPQTRALIEEKEIVYLIGDWTNYDADITSYLETFGYRGVPIYVYYGKPDVKTGRRPQPEILPQILTPGIVAEAFES